jgi:hypothetical protein
MAEPSWVPTLATVILSDLTLSLLKGKGGEEPAVVLRSTHSKEKTKIYAENLQFWPNFCKTISTLTHSLFRAFFMLNGES